MNKVERIATDTLTGKMFVPEPNARIQIDLSKLGRDVRIVSDHEHVIWPRDENTDNKMAKLLTITVDNGIRPSTTLINVLNGVCGVVGAEEVCGEIMKHSKLRLIADAIL